MTAYEVTCELKSPYGSKNTAGEPVDVPEQHFLAVDGPGDPNEARYAVVYTFEFPAERESADFVVAPLEGL